MIHWPPFTLLSLPAAFSLNQPLHLTTGGIYRATYQIGELHEEVLNMPGGPTGLPLSTGKHMHMKKLLETGEGDAWKDQGSTSTVCTVPVPTNLDDVPHLTGHQAEYSTRFCFNIVKVRPKLMLHAF